MLTLISVQPKLNENQKIVKKVLNKYLSPERYILTSNWEENYGQFNNLNRKVYRDFCKTKVMTVSAPFKSNLVKDTNEDFTLAEAEDLSVFVTVKGVRFQGNVPYLPQETIDSLLDCIVDNGYDVEKGLQNFLSLTNLKRSDFSLMLRTSKTPKVFVLNINDPKKISRTPIYLTLSQGPSMLMTTNYNYADTFQKYTGEQLSTVLPNELFSLFTERGEITVES